MRLAFVAPGNSIHTARWLEFFAERGHTVGLVSYGRLTVPLSGIEVLLELPRLGAGRGRRAGRVLALAGAALSVRGALRRFAPDLVHAHYLTGPGWLAAASGVRPLVLTGWGSDVLVDTARPLVRALHRRTVAAAAAATCESRVVAEALVGLGLDPDRVHVILWGVDTARFTPPGARTPGPFRVLAIRGVRPVHAPETILAAFELLAAEHDSRLSLMIGPTAESPSPQIAATIDRLRDAGLLELVATIPHEELPALFGAADACVSVPRSDSISIAVLEAMAAGRPVVVSDLPANRELIEDGVTGVIVPVDHAPALARALAGLAQDPERRERIGQAARQWAVQNADAATSLLRAEALYEAVAG